MPKSLFNKRDGAYSRRGVKLRDDAQKYVEKLARPLIKQGYSWMEINYILSDAAAYPTLRLHLAHEASKRLRKHRKKA